MTKLSKYATKVDSLVVQSTENVVENFMSGNSYEISPLATLRIVAASSIFGEPQYYREGLKILNSRTLRENSILSKLFGDLNKKTSVEIFTDAVDSSLDHDFRGTLDLALELRNDYFMRLNPAVIFVKASLHPGRKKFNQENPGLMRSIGRAISLRPDDITNQFEYFMYSVKKKNGLPSILKRTWADSMESFSRYQLNKYKGRRLIDIVRISHANSEDINELMKTGKLEIKENEQTWESLRSAGKTWLEITSTIQIPHMALLRNLRGIFSEIDDHATASRILSHMKGGVLKGKQFPFRYFTAYQAVENGDVNHKMMILDALEECMDISVSNMPKLDGKTICLSDNSGSSWGICNSEYGSVRVAEIANLSSLITAMQSDEGEIGLFGDDLHIQEVSRRNGLLKQHKEVNAVEKEHGKLGGGTENGIWLFFDRAIREKIHYDNIFIYSDMQASHGGLYGLNPDEYSKYIHRNSVNHIDVLSLAAKYRETVNRKVNLFTVQVAGYNNSVLPENLYRGAILAGWTGKEPLYAKSIIDTWNQIES